MQKFIRLFVLAITALTLLNCSRDPQVIKKKYLDSGNKYFDRGKYKEASIMYRRALATDQKYGEAYYKLALTSLRLGQFANAVPALRRAVELLPKGSKENIDAYFLLGEILVSAGQTTPIQAQVQPLFGEAQAIAKGFQDNAPNLFEGHKLMADLYLGMAMKLGKSGEAPEAKKSLEDAIAEYRKSLQLRNNDQSSMLSLARALAMHGDIPESEKLYLSLLQLNPKNTVAYAELARLYAVIRRPQDAEAILKRGIAANPTEPAFKTMLATLYFGQNNRAEGAKILDDMKNNLRQFPQAYFTAGDFYLRANDPAQAIKEYQEGENKDTAHKVDYQKRVIEVLIREGKTKEAYEKNAEILKANPKDPEARGLKASFMLDKGDVNQAINELQSVVTARPDNFVARFNLGRAHMARKEFEQARQQFDKSIELRPDYLPPRLALAQVALARGDYPGALQQAQEALKVSPQNGAAKLLESSALMRMQKFDESRTVLTKILQTNPKQPATLIEMGTLNLMEKKYQEASNVFRQAYELDPNNTRGLLGQAESYLLMKKPEEALKLIREEAERFPSRPELRRDLADLERRTGNYERAIQDYQALLAVYKDNIQQQADLNVRIGESYMQSKQPGKAVIYLEKARTLMPENVPLMNTLALLLENMGNHQEALKLYEQSIAKDQNNPQALNNLAFLMAETGGNLDQALTLANRAKQRLPNFPEVSDTIGWIYLKKNMSGNAVEIFKDLTAKAPANPTYRYHFAMALLQQGDKPAAKKQCELALQNNPNKEEEGRIRDLLSKT